MNKLATNGSAYSAEPSQGGRAPTAHTLKKLHLESKVGIVIGAIGLFGAAVAVWMAKRHDADLIQATKVLQNQLTEVRHIAQSVSTRYVSEYPRFVSAISDLINREDRDRLSLEKEQATPSKRATLGYVIMCDHPAFAGVSSPTPAFGMIDTFEYLQSAHSEVTSPLFLVCLAPTPRISLVCQQIVGTSDIPSLSAPPVVKRWENWKSIHKEDLVDFYKRSQPHLLNLHEGDFSPALVKFLPQGFRLDTRKAVEDLSLYDFVCAFEVLNAHVVSQIEASNHGHVREVDGPLNLHFWISVQRAPVPEGPRPIGDLVGREAIFAVASSLPTANELGFFVSETGFSTKDRDLLDAFLKTARTYFESDIGKTSDP